MNGGVTCLHSCASAVAPESRGCSPCGGRSIMPDWKRGGDTTGFMAKNCDSRVIRKKFPRWQADLDNQGKNSRGNPLAGLQFHQLPRLRLDVFLFNSSRISLSAVISSR